MFPKTVKIALANQLRDEIVRGTFVPGERLRLEDLARRYDVSTMPIREALSTLEAEGLVTILPHRGAQVTRFSAEELRELYEIRANLEAMATEKAIQNLRVEDLEQLEILMNEMDALPGEHDVAVFSQKNMAFHHLLYGRALAPHLSKLIRDLRYQVQHYLHKHLESTGHHRVGNDEHRRIIALARQGDASGAGQEMHRHILETGQKIADIVQQEDALLVTQMNSTRVGTAETR